MIAAVARKSNGVMAPRLTGPPLGPDLRLYKEKPQPVTRLKVPRNQLAEAVALPVRLDVNAEQVIHKLKLMKSAAPSGGGTSGGDKEGWRPRWNNSWGDGIAWWNLLANAELMTPVGRRFIPDPHYQGDGLSPPQRDPLVYYINNVIPWDHALLEAREKANKATLHSQRQRAQHKELKEKPPDNGSVNRTQESALVAPVSPMKEQYTSGSVPKGDIPYLKEQQRLRLLNIHVTVEQLKEARAEMLRPTAVMTVLDVSKIDEAPPWDEDDEAFNSVNYISEADAELNRQALAELRAEQSLYATEYISEGGDYQQWLANRAIFNKPRAVELYLVDEQRTYESDISDEQMDDARTQARMRMFGDRIGVLLNRDGGVNVGVGCVAKRSTEYHSEVSVSFQITEGMWYEVRMSDIRFFRYLEDADYEVDDFIWDGGFPRVLHRESAKQVFERYDLTSYERVGDNEFLLWPATDLHKISNWVDSVARKNVSHGVRMPTDVEVQLEYKEFRKSLHLEQVRQHMKKATLKRFGTPNPHAEDDHHRYEAWLEQKTRYMWRYPTLSERVKGSVQRGLSKLRSWMNEEIELGRKDVRPRVQEEITEYEQMKLNAIARAIVQKAKENKSPLKDGRLHDDEYDLKFLEGIGVTREEVIDYKVKKMGLPEDKYTLSKGGIVVPKTFTFSSIDPLKLRKA